MVLRDGSTRPAWIQGYVNEHGLIRWSQDEVVAKRELVL